MKKIELLQILRERVSQCQKCPELVTNRTQTVFDSGDPNSKILLLAEAGGREEDKHGEVLIGDAGKRLNKMLTLAGLDRKDLYACNILKCRPPNNRVPTPDECSNCREFLDLQIKIINPTHIVCLGATAAQKLLGTDTPISQMRGTWYEYGKAKVMATFHPAYVLRKPEAENGVIADLQMLIADLSK